MNEGDEDELVQCTVCVKTRGWRCPNWVRKGDMPVNKNRRDGARCSALCAKHRKSTEDRNKKRRGTVKRKASNKKADDKKKGTQAYIDKGKRLAVRKQVPGSTQRAHNLVHSNLHSTLKHRTASGKRFLEAAGFASKAAAQAHFRELAAAKLGKPAEAVDFATDFGVRAGQLTLDLKIPHHAFKSAVLPDEAEAADLTEAVATQELAKAYSRANMQLLTKPETGSKGVGFSKADDPGAAYWPREWGGVFPSDAEIERMVTEAGTAHLDAD